MPTVLLPKAKEVREVDLAACLLEERIVYFGTDVNNDSSNACVQSLIYLAARDAKAPITMYLNSPGGSVVDGMAIYDTMQRIAPPVHVIVAGMAASMGSIILSGGAKGERAIMPHGEVLLHQPLGGARGPATDIQISAVRILKTKEQLIRLLAKNCGQKYEKVLEDCDRDYWLDAEEALAYGIVDKII
jgi:ATP-dependent Clp protease protease subunit